MRRFFALAVLSIPCGTAFALPSCLTLPLTYNQIQSALQAQQANFANPQSDDWVAWMNAAATSLGCEFTGPDIIFQNGFETPTPTTININSSLRALSSSTNISAPVQKPIDIRAALRAAVSSSNTSSAPVQKTTDISRVDALSALTNSSGTQCTGDPTPTYCHNVAYCGPGNSSVNPKLQLITGAVSDTLNRACYTHDVCYTQTCMHKACYFSSVNSAASTCDAPLYNTCLSLLNTVNDDDAFVCASVSLLLATPRLPGCSSPNCNDVSAPVCDSSTGACQASCGGTVCTSSEPYCYPPATGGSPTTALQCCSSAGVCSNNVEPAIFCCDSGHTCNPGVGCN